jgi:hypothetical protein
LQKRIGLLAILLLAAASACAQQASVKGTIVDSEGAVIGNAYVLLRTDMLERGNAKAYQVELRTNGQGQFVTSVPSGFYDLFIGAQGFEPYCQKVRTREGHPQDLRVSLKVDQLMVNEYGDEFVEPQQPETKPR